MKYIKSYKIFESSDEYEYLIEDIKDLLIDLEDQDFSVNVFKRAYHGDEDIVVSIYKEKKPNPLGDLGRLGIFKYSDVSFYVERLVNFMKDYNYTLRNDLDNIELNTTFVTSPYDFSQVIRTSLILNFNNK